MTIYFVRHEERPMDDSTFLIELTEAGKNRAATSLKNTLLKLNINTVYCSPFVRCLQTINPLKKADLRLMLKLYTRSILGSKFR